MQDAEVLQTIERLVAEEHALWNRGGETPLSAAERDRLHSLQMTLDQCWDYLRQRRARRAAGLDPEGAEPRAPETIKHYEQ